MMAKECNGDQDPFSCSICLDSIQDPVTIPCGHNYCMGCIKDYWGKHGSEETGYSCPQCREIFTSRPALNKNTMFAEVVERFKRTGLQDSSPTHFNGPGRRASETQNLKTQKFSECEHSCSKTHSIQRNDNYTREKHTVIVVSREPQGTICSQHNKLLGVYCRTDQQFICPQCLEDHHQGHDVFSMAPEKTETLERRTSLVKEGHGTRSKTNGHGKRNHKKSVHGTGHRHGHNSGHPLGSHANSGHESGQQKSGGHRVKSHGHSHGAGHGRHGSHCHGGFHTGHGRSWH